MCRTYNFGAVGSSEGQFYYRYLLPIKLNDVNIDWSTVVRDSHLPLAGPRLQIEPVTAVPYSVLTGSSSSRELPGLAVETHDGRWYPLLFHCAPERADGAGFCRVLVIYTAGIGVDSPP